MDLAISRLYVNGRSEFDSCQIFVFLLDTATAQFVINTMSVLMPVI